MQIFYHFEFHTNETVKAADCDFFGGSGVVKADM
jgi:hypothetical protein